MKMLVGLSILERKKRFVPVLLFKPFLTLTEYIELATPECSRPVCGPFAVCCSHGALGMHVDNVDNVHARW